MADMAVDIVKEYREALTTAIESNDKSAKDAAATIDKVIDIYSKELDKDDLSTEERMQIIDAMGKALDYKFELHKSNQKFLTGSTNGFAVFIIGLLFIGIGTFLGSNGSISLPYFDEDDDK